MKMTITLLVLLAGLIVSCSGPNQQTYQNEVIKINDIKPNILLDTNKVITVQGCEYFVTYAYHTYNYIHKGNCKNPIHYCKCKN